MKPVAKKYHWLVPLERLIGSWRVTLEPGYLSEDLPNAKVAALVNERVEKVFRWLGETPKENDIDTKRKWQTHWRKERELKRLHLQLARLGVKVQYKKGFAMISDMYMADVTDDPEEIFEVTTEVCDQIVRRYQENGISVELTTTEGALILMAKYLFEIATDRMGHQPKHEWLDELAQPVFIQRWFGWGFCPLAMKLLEKK